MGYDDTTWEPLEHVADTIALDEWEQRLQSLAEAYFSGTIDPEPQTYVEAMRRSDSHLWKEAIDKELEAIDKMATWENR